MCDMPGTHGSFFSDEQRVLPTSPVGQDIMRLRGMLLLITPSISCLLTTKTAHKELHITLKAILTYKSGQMNSKFCSFINLAKHENFMNFMNLIVFIRRQIRVLAGVAQWIVCRPVNHSVASSIPS